MCTEVAVSDAAAVLAGLETAELISRVMLSDSAKKKKKWKGWRAMDHLDLVLSGAYLCHVPCVHFTRPPDRREMNWLRQGGAHVLFHQIFSLLRLAGWLVVNYFPKMISRGAESSIRWSFLFCQQLTQMNLANRMLSRDAFALNPQVQHAAAPAARRLAEGVVRPGTQLCSSAGWVQRRVE